MARGVLILGILGAVLVGAALFFVFRGRPAGEEALERGRLPAPDLRGGVAPREEVIGKAPLRAEVIAPAEKKIPGEVIDLSGEPVFALSPEEAVKKSEELVKRGLEFLKNPTAETPQPPSAPIVSTPTTTYAKLTEKEIFEIVWPLPYRTALSNVLGLKIQDGVLISGVSSPLSGEGIEGAEQDKPVVQNFSIPGGEDMVLERDEDIYNALKLIAAEMRHQGLMSEEDYEVAIRGATIILPQLIDREKEILRQKGKFDILLPGYIKVASSPNAFDRINTFFEGLLLVIHPANAGWVTSPDCYKDDDPTSNVTGFNAQPPLPCCNCGLHGLPCKKGCCIHFEQDCGEQAAHCRAGCFYRPLGCLNAVCEGWPNAIWDSESNQCGCG